MNRRAIRGALSRHPDPLLADAEGDDREATAERVAEEAAEARLADALDRATRDLGMGGE
jgi:hypothetical protein